MSVLRNLFSIRRPSTNAPMFAYICANRVGHQAWETALHTTYANTVKRKLLVIYSNNVANKSFGALRGSEVKFIQLNSAFIIINNRLSLYAIRLLSKMIKFLKRIAKFVYGLFNGNDRSPKDVNRLDVAATEKKQVRYSNDFFGYVFDAFFKMLPSFRSAPSNGMTVQDEYGLGFLAGKFKPLNINDFERGESIITSLGLRNADWFVCLHVRDSSFLGDNYREWQNQEIDRYIKAIKYITEMGGYVVRMGKHTVNKMPIMKNVIDYANSEQQSDFADIYLSSRARFAIVNNSGYRAIPQLFGVPLLTVNQYPITPMDVSSKSLIIFKKVYSITLRRLLKIDEILADAQLCHYGKDHEYLRAGLKIYENDEDEILDAVIEMLQLVSSNNWPALSEKQELFQAELRRGLKSSHHVYGNGITMFYPDLICRIGTKYVDFNWGKFAGNGVSNSYK